MSVNLNHGRVWLSAAAIALLQGAWSPAAYSQVTVYGSLSNFDVPNETDDDCDEFEIELHGPHPEDVYHTYHNGNYGSPEVLATASGTLVRYSRPAHLTHPGSIEHFGVSLRNFNADPTPTFTWKLRGQPAGINPNPLQPKIIAEADFNSEGDRILNETVLNSDPYNRRMWIRRSVANVTYRVALEDLMPDSQVVQESQDIDGGGPILLWPGQSVTYSQLEVEDGVFSAVINYEVFRDSFVWGQHLPGSYAGMVMNAVELSTLNCQAGEPVITQQPEDATAPWGDDVDFSISVDNNGDFGEAVFQWFHEGIEIPDSNNDSITIRHLTSSDAGTYYCRISNDCGTAITQVARLITPPCYADFDHDGFVTGSDFDQYVAAFEIGYSTADFDLDGFVTGQDFDMFVEEFEIGC